MKAIRLFSNAKINLGLIIKGKRKDNYHLLETLYYPVMLSDEMIFKPLDKGEVRIVIEDLDEEIPLEQNLCFKAWKLICEKNEKACGIEILIKKRIPTGAGLGGGSSNAAFTMKALNEMYALGLSNSELAKMAEPLGADVPFFIYNEPLFASGIGTDFEPFSIDIPYEIRLEHTGIHSNTAKAYGNLRLEELSQDRSLQEMLAHPIEDWKDHVVNDLEAPVFTAFPEIRVAKEKLYEDGAVFAMMSGSGSTVFGFFPK